MIIFKLFRFIPYFILYAISDIAFLFIYYIHGYRKKIVRENLMNSFPDYSISEIIKIEKKTYKNLCDIILESLLLYSISKDEIQKRMKLLNPELLQSLKKDEERCILIGAHYNNWEWMGLSLSTYLKEDMYGVYKPLSNKYINKLMLKSRMRFGANIISMNNFAKTILKNQNFSINVMLADQSPHKNEVDFYCKFLNQDTPVYIGPEKLINAGNMKLFFIDVQRIKRGYYEMKIIPLYNKVSKEKGHITRMHVSYLNKLINKKPENWLWTHRRWKHS